MRSVKKSLIIAVSFLVIVISVLTLNFVLPHITTRNTEFDYSDRYYELLKKTLTQEERIKFIQEKWKIENAFKKKY